MPYRKIPLVKQNIYHICTKSIAGYIIFNSDKEYVRMLSTLSYYQYEEIDCRFSHFLLSEERSKKSLTSIQPAKKTIKIIAYCLMPTHIHLILEQLIDQGISRYMNLVLKSYSKYFNAKHKRKGPLWEGRFKSILIKSDEQLLHLTRYIHLNPVSAALVNLPQDWKFSSYGEYINLVKENTKICAFNDYLEISTMQYEKFVKDQIGYQRELQQIKHLALEG
ncbi:MAG: transposase [Candidatus Omnitrophota bacterium]